MGIYETYQRLHDVAFWPGMWADVKTHVKICIKFQILKSENRKPAGKIQQVSTSRPKRNARCWHHGTNAPKYSPERVPACLRGQFFSLGGAISHVECQCTNHCSDFSERGSDTMGCPDFILSDRGTQFLSAIFKEVCGKLGVTQKLTTTYHPQANMTERVNRTLKYMIAAYVEDNRKKWDQYLAELRLAVNSAIQETIGMTPAELHWGENCKVQWTNCCEARISLPIYPPMMLSIIYLNFYWKQRNVVKELRKDNFGATIKNRREAFFIEKDHVWCPK